ncbi:MAG: PilW family protein [Desulfobulbaceae bacterium]|nr:PilW family protein [Desulfobulbaceae bacterium]
MKTKLMDDSRGFTLVELMITVLISGIVIIAIYTAYLAQQRSHNAQNQVSEMQQNQRAALDSLVRNLRMVGYNPQDSANVFELLDIRSRDLDGIIAAGGNGSIQFSADIDEDGVLAATDTFTFSLIDFPITIPASQDGLTDLALNSGGGRQLVAESIQELRFAYAFDANDDGELDLSPNNNVIWAVDSDDDNVLDTWLDTNDDGVIDDNDVVGGAALPVATPAITEIRSVRVWILARAKVRDEAFYNSMTYVVGDRQITPNDNFRRRLLEQTIYLRNLE